MAKSKKRWVLAVAVVSTAHFVSTLYFIREQPRDLLTENDIRPRDDLVTLKQEQIASLAAKTQLPAKVSSVRKLFQAPGGTFVVWDSTKDLVLKYDFHPKEANFTVGVVTTAIGKYIQFLDGFISSVDKYFLVGEQLTYVIFTDHIEEARSLPSDRPKILFREENMGWPFNALMLYEFLNEYKQTLLTFDYVYVFDVDIAVEAEVGHEILGMRVGTIHPGFFTKPRSEYSYDPNPKSTAYIDKTKEGVYYFAGALFGGCSSEVASMASTIYRNVRKDLEIDYIAVWHDESHLNRYFVDHPPTKLLSPEYMAPPNWPDLINMKHKIIALDKNHAEVRSMD